MKKLILTTLVASAIAGSAFAQGFVDFSTGATASNKISTNSAVGGALTGTTAATAGLYYYALFVSTGQTSVGGNTNAILGFSANTVLANLGDGQADAWELVGIGASQATAGRQGAISQGSTSGSQSALNSDNSMTVQGVLGAANVNTVAIGWSANIGSTLAALEAWFNTPGTGGATTVWLGQSQVGVGLTLGNGALVGTPNAMGPNAGQFPGFALGQYTVIPEPGTMALAALGGASLLMFRRKK